MNHLHKETQDNLVIELTKENLADLYIKQHGCYDDEEAYAELVALLTLCYNLGKKDK